MKRTTQAILFLWHLFAAVSVPSQAATILYDDFSDGSVTDGNPVSWAVSPFVGGGSIAVEDGNLMLYPTDRIVLALPDTGFLTDVSMRMQIRVLDHHPDGYFALLAHGNDEIQLDQYAGYHRGDAFHFSIGSKLFDNISIPIDLDATTEDIVIQFDKIGSQLSAWAWSAGSAPPSEPLITTIDNQIPEGKAAIIFGTSRTSWVEGDPTPRSMAVRYFHLSDTHISIPEPLIPTAIYEVYDETFDNLGDQVVDASTASVASVGEVDNSDVNKISRLIAKFNLPESPTGILERATLRFMPVRIMGTPAGPASVWHSQADNDLDQLATDFEDSSYNDTSQDLIQPDDILDFLNPEIYEVDVTSQVLADYATDGSNPMSAFRLQIDESVFFEDDASNQFRLSMPNGTFSPELYLYFVPEPNTVAFAIVATIFCCCRRRR